MTTKRIIATEARRKELIRLLDENPKITIGELSRVIGCSRAIISKDYKVISSNDGEDWDFIYHIRENFGAFRIRARRYGVLDSLTTEELTVIAMDSKGYCFYCKNYIGLHSIGFDHIIPMSKGGENSHLNLVPCCIYCNVSKKDRIK